MYLLTQSGSHMAINSRSMRLFPSIAEAGLVIINAWKTEKSSRSLERYITAYGGKYRIYELETDKETPKKIMGKALWKAMNNEAELKQEITKALLKAGV
jgi:hypothetical protein